MKYEVFYNNNLRSWVCPIVDRISPFLSDKLCLKLQFLCRMGYRLNLKNPVSFSEKLQWLKLYDRNSKYTKLVDKYEVKQYISEIISESYIIPTIGVWDSCDQINWNSLPNQFVLKTTHSGGSAGVIICKDKSKLNIQSVNKLLSKSQKQSIYRTFREWPYKNIQPRIIAEQYMEQSDGSPLIDYKFFCFSGTPKFLYVRIPGSKPTVNYMTLNWERTSFRRFDCEPSDLIPEKPSQFDAMVKIVTDLSKDIPFVRVDLYEINKRVYFSELTFFPSSGLLPFVPPEWDFKLGDLLQLPPKRETR